LSAVDATVVICGYLRLSAVICGYLWLSVVICGYLRLSVVICCYLLLSVVIYRRCLFRHPHYQHALLFHSFYFSLVLFPTHLSFFFFLRPAGARTDSPLHAHDWRGGNGDVGDPVSGSVGVLARSLARVFFAHLI